MRTALVLVALVLIAIVPPTSPVVSTASAQLPPISEKLVIFNDTHLATYDTQHNWAGTGNSATDPIVIDALEYAATEQAIRLYNTTKHVVIRNADIQAVRGSVGIWLENVRNVKVESVHVEFHSSSCISIWNSSFVYVANSTIKACGQGIALNGVNNSTFVGNEISVSDSAFRLATTTPGGRSGGSTPPRVARDNTFISNNVAIASGQTAFFFADEASYRNTIDASNVVNFVPMRWHVGDKGTAAANKVIPAESVTVRGMTNAGQIMCYLCENVTFESPAASSGSAGGVAIVASRNVTVRAALVEGNAGGGIEARNSTDIRIENPSTNANGRGISFEAVTGGSIVGAIAQGNTKEGIRIAGGSANAIAGSTAVNNTDGIVLVGVTGTRVADSSATKNSADGLRSTSGRSNRFEGVESTENARSGFALIEETNSVVNGSFAGGNARAGIELGSKTILTRILGNEVGGNRQAGIWLESAGQLNTIEDNTLYENAAHVRITKSEDSSFASNAIDLDAAKETGFFFDDEMSYRQRIPDTNVVGDTPMQWHVALLGFPQSPLTLEGLRVEQHNITNVAQIMIYKSSYVNVANAYAANGSRGIYVLRSSSASVTDSTATLSTTGIELRGTLTVDVLDTSVENNARGILIADTSNATISDIIAGGSRVGVEFEDKTSRGGVVQKVDASRVLVASIRDPSFVAGSPPRSNHLIVDAGLDKATGLGVNVTFNDSIATARFGSERILHQAWDFGDGETATSDEETLLRPVHNYSAVGEYVATYSVETAAGAFSDSVRVFIVNGSTPPTGLNLTEAGRGVVVNWTEPTGPLVPIHYKVYRGPSKNNLTLLAATKDNALKFEDRRPSRTSDLYYAVTVVTAAGESPHSEVVKLAKTSTTKPGAGANTTPTTTTPEEKGAPVGGPIVVAAALALAALVARRRR